MPRPVYIICSEGGSQDQQTNRLSIFNVIEKVQFSKREVEAGQKAIMSFSFDLWIISVWRRAPEDPVDAEFEIEVLLRMPEGKEVSLGLGPATLKSTDPEKALFRAVAVVKGMLFQQSGLLRVVARMRRAGTTEQWIEQEYPIPVEEVPPPQGVPSAEPIPKPTP